MCFKTPKTPDPPKVTPAPSRELVAVNAEQAGAKRRTEQQGIFSNIRTSVFGDAGYGKTTEAVKLGSVGAVA